MDSELKNSRLYRKLKVSNAAPLILGTVALVSLLVIEIFSLVVASSESLYGGDGTGMGLAVTALVLIIGAIVFFSVRKTRRMNAQKMKRLSALNYYDFTALEEQIAHTELMYKTFYLLDEYMYIPRAKLLIKYADIQNFQSIIHSTNGIKDGVKVKITDCDGIVYEAVVRQWRQYFINVDEFVETLNEKRRRCMERLS